VRALGSVVIHMLKERKGSEVTTKCGSMGNMDIVTVWWTDITCKDCRKLCWPKRIVKRSQPTG
jgi:hypothetical protein